MLAKETIDEYRPEKKFVPVLIMLLVGPILFLMIPVMLGVYVSDRTNAVITGIGLATALCASLYRYGSFGRPWDEKQRLNDRIGWQIVWSINAKGELTNEIERRDHQKSRLGWCLYEPLGGPHRKMFLARGRTGQVCVEAVKHVRVTRRSDEFVRVVAHWNDPVYDEMLSIETLLRVLEETCGILGEEALSRLLERVDALEFSSEFHKSALEKERESSEQLKATIAQLMQMPLRQLSENATSVLTKAAELAKVRSTRVKDLREILDEGLKEQQQIAQEANNAPTA